MSLNAVGGRMCLGVKQVSSYLDACQKSPEEICTTFETLNMRAGGVERNLKSEMMALGLDSS